MGLACKTAAFLGFQMNFLECLVMVLWLRCANRVCLSSGAATDHHSHNVVVKYFYSWRLCYLRVRQIAEFQGLVAEKGRQAKLRRALTSWRYCILSSTKQLLGSSVKFMLSYYFFQLIHEIFGLKPKKSFTVLELYAGWPSRIDVSYRKSF